MGIIPIAREDLDALRQCAKRRITDARHRRRSRVLEQLVLEVALGVGLRVSEITGIACRDLLLGKGSGSIYVLKGKGKNGRSLFRRVCVGC